MNLHSPFLALGGLGLWFLVLALPLIVYFVIAAFQINQSKGGPDIDRSVDREGEFDRLNKPIDKKAS